jgi:hypothetical protein
MEQNVGGSPHEVDEHGVEDDESELHEVVGSDQPPLAESLQPSDRIYCSQPDPAQKVLIELQAMERQADESLR